MAVSLEQYSQQLIDSQLMSAEELHVVLESLVDEQRPLDGEQLARLLVNRQKLTRFQARQIYYGQGRMLVLGNYVVLDKLGQGGMGMVLKAEHRRMKRLVAIKVLSPSVTKNPDAMRRFQHEVEAAAKLENPNIVTAYDADESRGTYFLVMQFVDGTDLAHLVQEQGPLAAHTAVRYVIQAARGLAYAHARGVIHRDIKPANLLLDHQDIVKVFDMGLAQLETATGEHDQPLDNGQVMGTADFMAPELAIDNQAVDARADIYSLGITLWYLLTGRPVFEGETVEQKLLAHQNCPVPSLNRACPSAMPQLEEVFERMVAKRPIDRHQSMAEVIAELEQCDSGNSPTRVSGNSTDTSQVIEFVRGMEIPDEPLS